jgi:hypothetical protein
MSPLGMVAWARRHSSVILTSAIALVIGGAVGAALSAGAGRRAETVTASASRTVTYVRTVAKAEGKAGTAVGQKRDTPSAAVTSHHSSSRVIEGPSTAAGNATSRGARILSGRGSTSLGTINLAAGTMIRWTNTSGHFLLLFDGGGVGVSSAAEQGELLAPAGVYRDVQIESVGRWTLRLG